MPVISFVSPKGGAGKTTAALLLSTELAQKGIPVTVIDADPEQWIRRWGEGGQIPAAMSIADRPTEETIIEQIDRARTGSAFVVVDLEGSSNMLVAYAISRSDLVVIPTQASTMDGKSAARAIKLVKQQERGFSKTIPFAVLFTRTSAAIKSRMQANLVEQLSKADVPTFHTQLLERNAYKAIFEFGTTLEGLPSRTYKLDEAIHNARAFAGEVISVAKQCNTAPGEQPGEEAAA